MIAFITATILATAASPVAASTDSNFSVQTNGIGGSEASGLKKVDSTLVHVATVMQAVRNRVAAILQQSGSLVEPELPQTIARLESEYASTKKRFDELERQVAELKAALEARQENRATDRASDDLRKHIEEAEKERERLKEKEARLLEDSSSVSEQEGPEAGSIARAGMEVRNVMLYENHVAPLQEPYYKFERVGSPFASGRKATRVRAGDPIHEAIQPGGCLQSLLAQMDPEKAYVLFLVCEDSIGAFRVAVSRAKGLGIRYGWFPVKDVPLYAGSTTIIIH